MEESKRKNSTEMNDKEIVYSKAIKAGKRIYYLDVKKNRKDEMFIAVTESKKIVNGEGMDAQFKFEKHKIFLYKEDFDKFLEGMKETISFVKENQPYEAPIKEEKVDVETTAGKQTTNSSESESSIGGEIKIDIDF